MERIGRATRHSLAQVEQGKGGIHLGKKAETATDIAEGLTSQKDDVRGHMLGQETVLWSRMDVPDLKPSQRRKIRRTMPKQTGRW